MMTRRILSFAIGLAVLLAFPSLAGRPGLGRQSAFMGPARSQATAALPSFPMYSGILYSLGTDDPGGSGPGGMTNHAETVAAATTMLAGVTHAFPNQGSYEHTRYYDNGAGSNSPNPLALKGIAYEANPTCQMGMYVNVMSCYLTQPTGNNFVYKPMELALYNFLEANDGWLRKITDGSIAQGSSNWGMMDVRTPGLAEVFAEQVILCRDEYGIDLIFYDEAHYTVEHLAKAVVNNIMGVPLTLTSVTSASSFACSQLSALTNDFDNTVIRFISGVNHSVDGGGNPTGPTRTITTYTQATGAMTFSSAFPSAPSVSDQWRFESTLNIANKPTDAEQTAGITEILVASADGHPEWNIWNGLLERADAENAFGGRMIQAGHSAAFASVSPLMQEVVDNFGLSKRIVMLEEQNDTLAERQYLACLSSLYDAQSGCGSNNFTTVLDMPYEAGSFGRPLEYLNGTSTEPVITVNGSLLSREFEHATVTVNTSSKTGSVVYH